MLDFKIKIVAACKCHLQDKIQALKLILQEITEAGNHETKRTAGDKHETSRAMLHLEQEKLGKQLAEFVQQQQEFDRIDFSKTFQYVGQGSLVETNQGFFFIAAAIGKLKLESEAVFVISHQSPIALKFKGLKQNEHCVLNAITYTIKALW